MSLESDLFAQLAAVCPRVYPDTAPDNPQLPYVTWQQIGGSVINPLANEVPNKRNAYLQVNVWAATRDEANTLAAAIEARLVQATVFVARPQSAIVALMDDEVQKRGTAQDFSIWASR